FPRKRQIKSAYLRTPLIYPSGQVASAGRWRRSVGGVNLLHDNQTSHDSLTAVTCCRMLGARRRSIGVATQQQKGLWRQTLRKWLADRGADFLAGSAAAFALRSASRRRNEGELQF